MSRGPISKSLFTLLKKELKDHFSSPLVYLLGSLFSLIVGWFFFNYLVLSKNPTSLTLIEGVVKPLLGNIHFLFIFIIPLITMGTFAEERKQNTLPLLLRSPMGPLDLILGKFSASMVVVIFLLLLTAICPLMIYLSGAEGMGVVYTGYLGLIGCSLCYVSLGIFSSSLTDNQIVAAILSFSLLIVVILLGLMANASSNVLVGQIFQYFSTPAHFEGLIRGAIKSFSLIYFLSFTIFFLFLTHLSIERQDW